MEDKFVPTPQAIMNQALRDLVVALDAVQRSQDLLLAQLKKSSPTPEIERYMRYGSPAPRRKNDAVGEKEFDEGVKQVEN